MNSLLIEYIELILEASEAGQSSLLASKILGYAAEWATWEACSGKSGFKFATLRDRRIQSIWADTTDKKTKEQFELTYQSMVDAAISKVSAIRLTGLRLSSPRAPDAGAATEKVDVVTSDTDIHVKFNDAIRLAGFQRIKDGVDASQTSIIYDKVMKEFGMSLELDARFIDKNGFLRRPGGVKGISKMNSSEKKAAMRLQSEFQDARDQYRLAFTNSKNNRETSGYREDFIKKLDVSGIRAAIIEDIKKQLLGDSGRAAVYFKYFSSGPDDVRLETHQYSVDDMIVTPITKEATKFYQVTSKDGKKIYFQIEFRLDGGGHPPQLKVGKDLDAE